MNKYRNSIGKRKTSIAKILLLSGFETITINNKIITKSSIYLNKNYSETILHPFNILNIKNQFDIIIKVHGGGVFSQISAIIVGLSKALSNLNYLYYKKLNKEKLFRIDSRMVERKKYGYKKARKATQYSKR